jgi:hypothetical protein
LELLLRDFSCCKAAPTTVAAYFLCRVVPGQRNQGKVRGKKFVREIREKSGNSKIWSGKSFISRKSLILPSERCQPRASIVDQGKAEIKCGQGKRFAETCNNPALNKLPQNLMAYSLIILKAILVWTVRLHERYGFQCN